MRDRLIKLIDYILEHPEKTCLQFHRGCSGCKYEELDCCKADRIADYLLENCVIVPPCKVGDKVWLIKSINWQHTEFEIKDGKVSMIQQKANKSWKFRITENHSVQDFTVDKLGKTVFLTREKAEKALKGSENNA